MKKKTLSTSPQTPPRDTFASLPKAPYAVFSFLLEEAVKYPSLYYAQETIAKAVGYKSARTANRAIKHLVKAGLVIAQYRPNKTSLYQINPILLTVPQWHNELYYWFKRYPAFVRTAIKTIPLALSLLFSPLLAKCTTKNYPDTDLVYQSTKLSSLRQILSLKPPAVSYVGYPKGKIDAKKITESIVVEQINYNKAKFARAIALALIKRGARLTNTEALGIMAFDETVLHKATAVMKQRSALQHPDRYFIGVCRKLTEETGGGLDRETVEYMRDNAVRLLTEAEETASLQQPEPSIVFQGTQKREPRETSYNEQVKQRMQQEREASEARNPAKLDRDTEITQCRASLAELEAKKEAGCPFAAMSASIVRKLLADLEGLPVNHPVEPEAIRCSSAEGAAVLQSWAPLLAKPAPAVPKRYNGWVFDREEDE